MDLNSAYSDHQAALMHAAQAGDAGSKSGYLAQADLLAAQIGAFQLELGAAAACAWSATRFAAPVTL